MSMDSSTMSSTTNETTYSTPISVLENLYDVGHYIKRRGPPILKHFDNKTYRVDVYQDCHADEYTVYELVEGSDGANDNDRDGLAQHFKKGVLQLSWQMEKGQQSGALTIYVNGIVERMTSWSSLRNLDNKRKGMKSKGGKGDGFDDDDANYIYGEVHNERGVGHILIERNLLTDQIVYRGGYNELSLRREGYGICYDKVSGVEKSFGYYVNGDLDHLIQEFVLENDLNGNENGKKSGKKDDRRVSEDEKVDHSTNQLMMIEYGGDVLENNIKFPYNRNPIYVGGYTVKGELQIENEASETDQEKKPNNGFLLKSPFIRHGHGYVMNELSGICDHESDWCNGVENNESISQLYRGWYDNVTTGRRRSKKSDEEHDEHDEHGKNEMISINVSMIDEGARKRREEEEERRELERKAAEEEHQRWLCSEIPLCGELGLIRRRDITKLVIDNNAYNGTVSSGVSVKLDEMPNLEELSIGNNNFQQVRGFVLNNLPSLKKVHIGSDCFRITREWTGDWSTERQDGIFSITNCPNLISLQIGDHSFADFKTFSMSSVDLLNSIEFGKDNFDFADCVLKSMCFGFWYSL